MMKTEPVEDSLLRKPPIEIIWNLIFWAFQMTSFEKNAKMKVVDLEKLWNFVVDNFFIWNHLLVENYVWIS